MRFRRPKLMIGFGLIMAAAGIVHVTRMPGATGFVRKAQLDETVRIADGDPAMNKAFDQAQLTLPQFINTINNPPVGTSNFSVKVGVKVPGGIEYIWLASPRISDTTVTGVVNNTPEKIRELREGQTVTYAKSTVVDWTYQDSGAMRGNFTACALLTHASAEERDQFYKTYRIDCSTIE